jgi:hypothetical protein
VHRFTVENGTPRFLWPAAELDGPADVVELEAAEAVKAEKIAAQRRAGRGRTRGQGSGGAAGDVQPA